jgi:uncharacterized protein (TIGR02466 family)
MEFEHLWPTGIGHFNMNWTNSEISELIEELYSIKEIEISTGEDLYQYSMSGNGYHTKSNLFCSDSILIKKLRITFEDEFNKYTKKMMGADIPPFGYSHAWAMFYNNTGMSKPHVHPGALLSGVLYLKIPDSNDERDSAGKLHFLDPRPGAGFSKNEYTPSESIAATKEGSGIIFPSWLAHYVTPTNSDEERISIAVNLFIPMPMEDMTYIERDLRNNLENNTETT